MVIVARGRALDAGEVDIVRFLGRTFAGGAGSISDGAILAVAFASRYVELPRGRAERLSRVEMLLAMEMES